MIEKVFDALSSNISKEYRKYIADTFESGSESLDQLYCSYTSLDAFYPRPILTYLGTKYDANHLSDFDTHAFPTVIFIPQIVRDFLAIHDDVIDEDLIKFNTDTFPFAISKQYNPHVEYMTKKGKDLAIVFADYSIPIIYNIASHTERDEKVRLALVNAISRVLLKTCTGQIMELELEQRMPFSIDENEILMLYDRKAADYCYAFPFELGMIYAGAPSELIDDSRKILLQIGACSQVVNDIEGIFYESYGDERDTVSDLLALRRTYLLVKLSHMTASDMVKGLLEKDSLTDGEAQTIKDEMIACNLLGSVCSDIYKICSDISARIKTLN